MQQGVAYIKLFRDGVSYLEDENGELIPQISVSDTANISCGNCGKYEIHFSINIPEDGVFSFQATNTTAKVMFNHKECLSFAEIGREQNGNCSLNFKRKGRCRYTGGSPVELPWIDSAKTVLWNWYAGMEGGNVLADALMGTINPSGKLPFTMPKKYEDSPVARYGEYNDVNCKYNEDILVGYRGFDYDNIELLFPFGYGLSYTNFEYNDLIVTSKYGGINVSFELTNVGKIVGKETAQLKNFQKVELKPNESAKISLDIPKQELCFYDEHISDWKFESGEFKIFVGSSSRDIRLIGSIVR